MYESLNPNLSKAIEFICNNDLNALPLGRNEICGELVFANIVEIEPKSKEEAKLEVHRKYIDIQYVIKGEEKIGVTDISNCTTCIEYDEERDLEFFTINTNEEFIEIKEGTFAIFYPHDTHKPSISINQPSTVKKVVVKVAI